MAEEFSQAVSFVNSYFALVDGLASDLEHHLAEDVVLDWFGQTVRGRKHVASFMKFQKIKSKHVFSEITPKTDIGYRENRSLRRKYYSVGGSLDNNNLQSPGGMDCPYKRKCYSDVFSQDHQTSADDSIVSDTSCEMSSDFHTTEELHYGKMQPPITDIVIQEELNLQNLHLDFLSTPHLTLQPDISEDAMTTPDIAVAVSLEPTNMDEMEMNIAELKARELVNRDGQDSKKSSLKFLEACGVIEFCRVFSVQQIRRDTRKRHCKLQIAYSVDHENAKSQLLEKRSVDGIETDGEKDKNQFIQCLQKQMMKQESTANSFMTPKYVRGQLKFDVVDHGALGGSGDSDFIFNYKIHVIIYESNTKCRLNLSHEFEGEEYDETDDQ